MRLGERRARANWSEWRRRPRFATLLSACQTDQGPSDKHYRHVVVNLSLECPMPSFDGSLERCDGTSDESYWPKLKNLVHVAAPVASLFAAVDLLSEDRAGDPGDLSIRPVTGHTMATTTLDDAPLVAGFGDGSGDDAASLLRSRE